MLLKYDHTNTVNYVDAVGSGVGVAFDALVDGSQEPASGSTILLANSRQSGEGSFQGIEITVERAGCFSVQVR